MIAVTGASGKLGGLVLERLLKLVPSDRLVAIARNPETVERFAVLGVHARQGDYSRPETLSPALAGVKQLLLVSGNELGQRVGQHAAVIEAASAAGVELIAYTSVLRADTSTLPVVPEHKATEAVLRASGLPFVLLRNGWYIENYTEDLATTLAIGAVLGSAGDGRIAAASRADLATAAATVLTTEGHAGKTYELAGDRAFTLTELAEAISQWAGRPIPYKDLPLAEYEEALVQAGVPEAFAKVYAGADVGIANGELDSTSQDLHTLIGRDTETLQEILARIPRP